MKYHGNELIEITPDQWNGKSRKMLVWDDTSRKPLERIVVGYYPHEQDNCWMAIGPYSAGCSWQHCAELPKEEPKIEIKPKYDFVENILKAAPKVNNCIILSKRAVEQMHEMEKAFGIVYEENENLKAKLESFGELHKIAEFEQNKILKDKSEKKTRRMTYNEIEEWLIQCNGLIRIGNKTYNNIYFDCEDRNKEVRDGIEICGHKEHTWHEPMIEE